MDCYCYYCTITVCLFLLFVRMHVCTHTLYLFFLSYIILLTRYNAYLFCRASTSKNCIALSGTYANKILVFELAHVNLLRYFLKSQSRRPTYKCMCTIPNLCLTKCIYILSPTTDPPQTLGLIVYISQMFPCHPSCIEA